MAQLRALTAMALSLSMFVVSIRLSAEQPTTDPSSAKSAEHALPSVRDRFADSETSDIPDFQKHVIPLLGRLGCNGRSCHGSFQGRGGMQLSLFGYDFDMDHQALVGMSSSEDESRLDRAQIDDSLIIRKPSLQIDHEGGRRFDIGSWQHHLVRRWIESGAKGVAKPQVLSRLEVEPSEWVFDQTPQPVSLKVIAEWQDGWREDVTALCRFRTNNDSVATVDASGSINSVGPGDTQIVVFYDNGIVAVPVLRPFMLPESSASATRTASSDDSHNPTDDGATEIDRLVRAKLDKLGITPSDRCSDAEFLRRVSVDVTGTLPTPDEIVAFLADPDADKRTKKVDELLGRPAYAANWANKLCDFTGCNPAQQAELGQETAEQWYMWIYDRVARNVPYDELVRGIVLAQGRDGGATYDEYAEQTSAYFRDSDPIEFAKRATMPHYWTRRSMQKPDEAAQAFAHNFLGVRLQCAQCHKHPFAPWTQDDFKEFSRFFENVTYGVRPESMNRYRELAKQVGLNLRGDKGTAVSPEALKQARRGRTVPWRELYIEPLQQPRTLDLLRSGPVTVQAEGDPRDPIMRWMRQADNPWFAKALVNRVWASYFHVGIIDPPDDLNPANPPSNPALLRWLADGFVEHDFDMKWLHRQIVTSQTYQRSWKPNSTNHKDHHNYSRAVPRRLPAEVVYDSVKQALASADTADQVRTDLTRRAIGELSMRLAGTYAMQVFGKPDRAVNCDCERVNQPTLLQSVFLQNDPLMDQRLQESGWLEELSQQESGGGKLDVSKLVHEAWLRTLSRPPTDAELARAMEHFATTDSTIDGLRDLLWALINTKEFILIH